MTLRVSIFSLLIVFGLSSLIAQKPEQARSSNKHNYSELPSNWSLQISTYPLVQFIHYNEVDPFTSLISRSNDLEINYRMSKNTFLSDVLSFGVKADYDNLLDWDRMSYNIGYGKEAHIGFHRIHAYAGAKALMNATTFDKSQTAYSMQALGYGRLEVFLGERVSFSGHYNYLGSLDLALIKEISEEVVNKSSNLGTHFNKSYYFKFTFYL